MPNQHEKDFIQYIKDKKTLSNMSGAVKDMLIYIFGNSLQDDEVLDCIKCTGRIKPDVKVFSQHTSKYISLKNGSGNSVHQEKVDSFMDFLSSIGFSEEAKNLLKQFLYADGTINNTGLVRYASNEFKILYPQIIEQLQSELSKYNKQTLQLIRRSIIKGIEEDYVEIDALFYGDFENGVWSSTQELYDFIKKYNSNHNSDTVAIGPLTVQLWNKNIQRNPATEDRRLSIQLKWSSLKDNLTQITKERTL
jgi:hypothetical protein